MADLSIYIYLSKFGSQLFSGREFGRKIRKKIDLDSIDISGIKVNIILPKDLLTITSSFFLGLFDKSILYCGTKDKFFERFNFINVPELLNPQFAIWVDRILANRKYY